MTLIMMLTSACLCSRGLEQLDELLELVRAQVTQLLAMRRFDLRIELAQQLRSRRRDARTDDSAVLLFATPRDQPALLEAIEQASDIRIARDHARSDLAAGKTLSAGFR